MTNYNKRLDEILGRMLKANNLHILPFDKNIAQAKAALTSLIKELVAEAKPGSLPIFGSQNEAGDVSPSDYEAAGYNQAIKEFEQNLLKALEEV